MIFLHRFIAPRRSEDGSSRTMCATRLGASKAYLKLVIEKKRHISLNKVTQVCALFKLTQFEQQYFTILFLRTTSEDEALKRYFGSVLDRFAHRLRYAGAHEDNPSTEDREVVFRSWLYMVIHSLARFDGFEPTVEWIQGRLTGGKVTSLEIQQVLRELIGNGSIKQKDGKWGPDEFVFRNPDGFDGDQYKIYKIGVHRTDEALDDAARHRPSHYHMMSIGLDAQAHDQALKLYVEFRDRLIALSKQTLKPEKVFFLSNSIYCVASDPGSRN